MSNRIRITDQVPTRQEVESLVNEIALTVNNERKLKAEQDAKILEIKERYSSRIEACQAQCKALSLQVEAWAKANPEEFAKRKTVDFPAGKVGWRTGTPKLVPINRKWTWTSILEAVTQYLPNFIRTKPEVDKEGIIAQREELKEFLPMVGLKVTQDEAFFIEPDLEPITTKIK